MVIVAQQSSGRASLRGEVPTSSWLENIAQYAQGLRPGKPSGSVQPDSAKQRMTSEEFRAWAESTAAWSPVEAPDEKRTGELAGTRTLPPGGIPEERLLRTSPCAPDDMCVTPNIQTHDPAWFNDGTNFSAGCYAIEYVKGCRQVEGGHEEYLVHRSDNDRLDILYLDEARRSEGSVGPAPGTNDQHATLEECEQENSGERRSFYHRGGSIGLRYMDMNPPGVRTRYRVARRSPTFRITTAGDCTFAENNNCALCEYMDFPECAGAANAAACSEIAPPGYGTRECEWVGGRCISRFQRSCRQFLAAQATVPPANRFITSDIPTLLKTTDLSSCSPELILRLRAHANEGGVITLTNRTTMCIEAAPSCSGVTAFHTGCSAFSNLGATTRELQRFARTVPEGTRITLGGNQAVASEDVQTHLIFAVDCRGIQSTDYGPCHRPGEDRCHEVGEAVTCRDGAATRREICCTEQYGTNVWERPVGDRCPVLQCANLLGRWCIAGKTMSCMNAAGAAQPISCCVQDGSEEPHLGKWATGSACGCHSNAPASRACTNAGRVLDCKNSSGNAAKEICCRTTMTETKWSAGDSCPTPRQQSGTCRGDGDRYFKTNAIADLNASFERCAQRERTACVDARWNFTIGRCIETEHNGGVLGNWILFKVCPWTCAP